MQRMSASKERTGAARAVRSFSTLPKNLPGMGSTYYTLFLLIVILSGCQRELPEPPRPPVPQDLAAFQKPLLVRPPPPPEPGPPPLPPTRPAAPNEALYEWQPGTEFEVLVQLGTPTDVTLQDGEVVSAIFEGDRTPLQDTETQETPQAAVPSDKNCSGQGRWNRCHAISHQASTPVQHVVFTAAHIGHTEGVVIYTDRRAYYLTVKAVKQTPVRVVRWSYPPEPPKPPAPKPPGLLPERGVTGEYHVGYTMQTTQGPENPEWRPVQVVSATKMYVQFPVTLRYMRAPLVRGLERGKPYLLNSAWMDTPSGPVLVVDELAPGLEVRRGVEDDAQVLQILRGDLRTIQCPGDEACPPWDF